MRSGLRSGVSRGRCGMRSCGSGRTRRLRARRAAREGHQGDVAGALDGHAQPALVPRAHASHAARQNLAALLHELRQNVSALVVDEVHLLDAELANFLFAEVLALAAGTPPRATGTAAWTAFAARTAAFPPRTALTAFGPGASVTTLGPRSSAWR